ncbi:MAG: PRC-barrel domain containing protein [Burkholderiaceae bacterium]|nr:PRC-barrel domain containing protein [Burkholderiaceae bacterium]
MDTTQSTAAAKIKLISSDKVQGTEVYGPDGEHVGEIDHLMIERVSGRVAYAVMSFGGFLGMGKDFYPVPWDALKYDTSLDGYRTNITREQVEGAPARTDDTSGWDDEQWNERLHEHYRAHPTYRGYL